MSRYRLMCSVRIGPTNDKIKTVEDLPLRPEVTYTIPHGVYWITGEYEDGDLCKALSTAASAMGLVVDFSIPDAASGARRCSMYSTSSSQWEISETNSTFDFSLLGYTPGVDIIGGLNVSPAVAQHTIRTEWVSTQLPGIDSYFIPRPGTVTHRARTARSYRFSTGDTVYTRTMRALAEPLYKGPGSVVSIFTDPGFWNTSPQKEQRYQSWTQFIIDASVADAHFLQPDMNEYTEIYLGHLTDDTINGFAPERFAPGVDLYSWDFGFLAERSVSFEDEMVFP